MHHDPNTPLRDRDGHVRVDAMNAEEAFEGLCQAYWRLLTAIDKKVHDETDGFPEFMADQIAKEVRQTCYPAEKKLWEDAYVRVMSSMARADIAAGFEPFTPYSEREALAQGALFS